MNLLELTSTMLSTFLFSAAKNLAQWCINNSFGVLDEARKKADLEIRINCVSRVILNV